MARPKALTAAQEARAGRLLRLTPCWTIAAIAREFLVSRSTIYRLRDPNDWPRRVRGLPRGGYWYQRNVQMWILKHPDSRNPSPAKARAP